MSVLSHLADASQREKGKGKTGAGGGRKNELITVPPQGRMSLELKKCFLQEKV